MAHFTGKNRRRWHSGSAQTESYE